MTKRRVGSLPMLNMALILSPPTCMIDIHMFVMQIYMHPYIHTCMVTCIHAYTHTSRYLYVHTHIQELFVPRPSATAPAFDLVCVVLVQITSF